MNEQSKPVLAVDEDAVDRAVEAFHDVYDGVSHNERDALRHVLATAESELLAACIDAVAELDDCCAFPRDDWDFYDKLTAAIAKATGRRREGE